MSHKLIILMLDGVSADYVATELHRLPNLAALAAAGHAVERLGAEVCGTSFPGRVSMLTGVTADVSGVYANKLWDPAAGRFRYAHPYDVRVPTIAGRARAAGRDVAVVGFGMVRPEDADLFLPPHWVRGFIQRARDAAPIPSDEPWLRVVAHRGQPERFARIAAAAGLPADWPQPGQPPVPRQLYYSICDFYACEWVGALAAADGAPDLIIGEVLLPDALQHDHGYKSDPAHWAIAYADTLVGLVLRRLHAAGRADRYNIAVMSDHGHSPIERAIRPDVVIPSATYQSDGSMLHVVPRDAAELARIEAALAAHGVTRHSSDHVPAEHRAAVVTFAAPDGASFEHDPPTPEGQPVAPPVALSSHGLRPGSPGDERFAVFSGPDVPRGRTATAAAVQVAPTFAALLGLPLDDFPAPPIFQPVGRGGRAG